MLNIPEGWDTTDDLVGYEVLKSNYGFIGRLVDENGEVISCVGMSQDNIGFSYDRDKTEKITRELYNEILKVKGDSKNV